MLLQYDNVINRLNRNNSYCLNKSLLDSSMTNLLPSTHKSPRYLDTPQFPRTPTQTTMIDFSHPVLNTGNTKPFKHLPHTMIKQIQTIRRPQPTIV